MNKQKISQIARHCVKWVRGETSPDRWNRIVHRARDRNNKIFPELRSWDYLAFSMGVDETKRIFHKQYDEERKYFANKYEEFCSESKLKTTER